MTTANISTPTGKRRLITPGNRPFTLAVDQLTRRNTVVAGKNATQLPPELLDSRVPASSQTSVADRLSVVLDISNSIFRYLYFYVQLF